MCISKMQTFLDIKDNIDSTLLNIGRPLRIKQIYSDQYYGCPMRDKKILKKVFQINTWCKMVI